MDYRKKNNHIVTIYFLKKIKLATDITNLIYMKTFLFTFIFTYLSFVANCQLKIKNNFSEPYKVAMAFYYSGFKFSGWISKGWMEIQPGEEKEFFYTNPREKYIYYYAFSATDTISGHKKVLVDPDKDFDVKNAILLITKEDNSNLEWFKFREVSRGMKTKRSRQLTMVLGE
jgi:uncharacterized membrane protein